MRIIIELDIDDREIATRADISNIEFAEDARLTIAQYALMLAQDAVHASNLVMYGLRYEAKVAVVPEEVMTAAQAARELGFLHGVEPRELTGTPEDWEFMKRLVRGE